ncbi:hypothetical protein Tco_0560499, partial [Tanacetum coccineum]
TSPQLTTVPVSSEEPTGKSKRVKRPAKKSTKAPARGVVIRETPEMPLSKKKEKVYVARGKGIELLSNVALTKEARDVSLCTDTPYLLDGYGVLSSWVSRMLLYIKVKERRKLLMNSVLNGPFKYGTVTVPGTVTAPATVKDRTYDELIDAEKIHEGCDIKPTNIVLQACSFMLCDLDFEPLSLSLSSLSSCDLVSLTNMLILLHYLESFKSEFAEVFVFKSYC